MGRRKREEPEPELEQVRLESPAGWIGAVILEKLAEGLAAMPSEIRVRLEPNEHFSVIQLFVEGEYSADWCRYRRAWQITEPRGRTYLRTMDLSAIAEAIQRLRTDAEEGASGG